MLQMLRTPPKSYDRHRKIYAEKKKPDEEATANRKKIIIKFKEKIDFLL